MQGIERVMASHWLLLALLPVSVAVVSLLSLPIVIYAARRCGIIDMPHPRKVHLAPTPRVGGVAIAGSALLGGALGLWALAAGGLVFPEDFAEQMIVVGAVLLFVFGVGLVDDIRTISPKFKALSLVAAALALAGIGVRLDLILLGGGREPMELGAIAWVLTPLFVVTLATALNFIDGLDGLCGGVSALAAAVCAAVLLIGGDVLLAILPLSLLAAIAGFLVLNRHPARVFMGDSGSMFIGVALAVCMMLANRSVGTMHGILLPLLALSVPLADTLVTFLRRKFVQRQSIFAAERGHIHHHLIDTGLTQRQAVYTIYAVSAASVAIGVVALLAPGWATLGILSLLVPLLYGLFRFAGSLTTRTMLGAVRRKRFIDRVYRNEERQLQDLQLRFRSAQDFQSWWQAVCDAATAFHFLRVDLPVIGRNGEVRRLEWRDMDADSSADEVCAIPRLSAKVPIRDRRADGPLEASVELAAADSLELAGHRLALFSRLMAEHAVADLQDTRGSRQHDDWQQVRERGVPAYKNGRQTEATGQADVDAGVQNGQADGSHEQKPEHEPTFLGELLRRSTFGFRLSRQIKKTEKERRAANQIVDPRELLTEPKSAAKDYDPSKPLEGLRVAVVHDFLYVYAGAERVLEQMIKVVPQCDVFALFDFLPTKSRTFLAGKEVKTSFIQRMPLARKKHRAFLPVMPLAIEQLDLSGYDLVISSSYLAAKGVITGPDQLHVCYCHSPARYAWDLQHQYLDRQGVGFGPKGILARAILQYIRNWDVRSAVGVDKFIANSEFIARRIGKVYRRSAEVIYPPVNTESFSVGDDRSEFYLTVSRLVPYKRIDILVEAFNKIPDKRLVVVGDGPEREALEKIAEPNVTFAGHQPQAEMLRYMQLAKAFVFAAEEDFGIVPVEAMACGTPVIAFGHGGVRESVVEGVTGMFFEEQNELSVIRAIRRFEADGLSADPDAIRAHAEHFNAGRFRDELRELLHRDWKAFRAAKRVVGPVSRRETQPDSVVVETLTPVSDPVSDPHDSGDADARVATP
ncbi:MAG: glycosyltransferase [Planctomycetota bacterium]